VVSLLKLQRIIKFQFRRLVRKNPSLTYFEFRFVRPRPKLLVRRDTDILIEGYPRSANTYTVLAIRQSNPGIVIANHLHAAAHVKLAVGYEVPVLVIIRDPDSAVRSLLVRRPDIHPKHAFIDYADFYSEVESLKESLVLAHFSTAVEDIEAVVRKINERFGLLLATEGLRESQGEVMNSIIQANRYANGGEVNPRSIPAPSVERNLYKEKISFDSCEDARLAAVSIYRRLLEHSI